LKDLVSVLLRRIEVLESENAALWAENAELRSRLNLNSKNSHKPPSSDGLSKKPGLPKGPAKKSGGQFGHKGRTLKMVEQADNFVLHHAPSCTCCARVFSASDVVCVEQRRQVFDIPAPRWR
jgi:transposase